MHASSHKYKYVVITDRVIHTIKVLPFYSNESKSSSFPHYDGGHSILNLLPSNVEEGPLEVHI